MAVIRIWQELQCDLIIIEHSICILVNLALYPIYFAQTNSEVKESPYSKHY
ncbi:hypothetical protein HCCG_01152 [Helicobacter cinaedi CCUG 18818 = ATCC BAA-847]|uniref:Uncharacterized protein n=1 Tax=Helicobacter cinaedi CCUG 18818 = ATCC BAA-847 TaxID=537971 RepID=A0ABN0BAH5_9HELI|nr:hypothetical protein [Helicobacter cinaedi]EFR46605.1 hypothetical protein HCCG_01152 [Helicobacter cinaedi CCUG 18818 = ATCC BAA-847]